MNSITRSQIVRDLRALGVQPGDLLFVHSSLSKIGWAEGGAEAVVDALLEAVGPNGTVAVPTLTCSAEDSPERPPVFDARETRCWTGRIPETFRLRPDARRSANPSHSVAAIGAKAAALIAGHEDCETPCGSGSPFEKLVDWGGKILLLGVDHRCNTTLHYVESVADCSYPLQKRRTETRFTDEAGREFTRSMRLHQWGTPRDFSKIEPELITAGAERVGNVGLASSRLIDAGKMVRMVLARMVSDPAYLLAKDAVPAVAPKVPIRIERMEHAAGLPLPKYATSGSAGMDLYAAVAEERTLQPGEWARIPTGMKIALPEGYEAQVRPRSGLAAKQGVTCLNSPGTIDSDYRGECQVILINHSMDPVVVRRGDRIAQMVIAAVTLAEWEPGPVDEDTERGAGGFGHTGVSEA
jgi:aminoglycoside 3-N-acetyltransferase